MLALCGGCTPKRPQAPARWYTPPSSYAPRPTGYVVPVQMQPLWPPIAPGYAAPAAPVLPRLVRVSFVGLLAGPGKVDRTQWDGPGGTVSAEGWQQVASAIGAADPYAAAIGVLAGPTIQALEKPDCAGSAVLTSSAGTAAAYALLKQQDTFTPQWGGVTWEHVSLDDTTRIRVTVVDRDLIFDDPMGIFEIPSRWIRAALAAGKVLAVPVHDQTNKQILFAMISAQVE